MPMNTSRYHLRKAIVARQWDGTEESAMAIAAEFDLPRSQWTISGGTLYVWGLVAHRTDWILRIPSFKGGCWQYQVMEAGDFRLAFEGLSEDQIQARMNSDELLAACKTARDAFGANAGKMAGAELDAYLLLDEVIANATEDRR